jgi:hypothetical protein
MVECCCFFVKFNSKNLLICYGSTEDVQYNAASEEYRTSTFLVQMLTAQRDALRYEQKERLTKAKVNARDIGENDGNV